MQKAGLMQEKTAGVTALEKCEMQARTEGSSKRFRGETGRGIGIGRRGVEFTAKVCSSRESSRIKIYWSLVSSNANQIGGDWEG